MTVSAAYSRQKATSAFLSTFVNLARNPLPLRRAMNIFIQRGETREFLADSPDDWVRDPHDANPFSDTRAALAYCRKHDLQDVRLVVVFGNRRISLLRCVSGSETPIPAGALKAAA